jgi:hypothetical protein
MTSREIMIALYLALGGSCLKFFSLQTCKDMSVGTAATRRAKQYQPKHQLEPCRAINTAIPNRK